MGAVAEEVVAAFPSDTVGVTFVALVAAAILALLFIRARRDNVTADNVIDDVSIPTDAFLAAA
jgi:hypothetical protein